MPREKMSDVIVLLPGLTGTVLQKDGKDVWSASIGAILGGLADRGGRFRELILNEDPVDRDDLGDGVVAARVMPDVHFIPGLWKIDGYSRIASVLKEHFDVAEGQNYFEFPYDWRRDNRVSARQLARRSHEWLSRWRQSSGNGGARLILIGHSMGGIVARCFLELMDGWRATRALITFGTPYRGSLNALDSLANGVRKGPFGMLDLTALTRSCTSVYQLLPLYPCYDPGDGRLLRVGEVSGVPNVDAIRAAQALAFHQEIVKAVDGHRNAEQDYRERGYRIWPIVGIAQPTLQSARRAGEKVELCQSHEGKDSSGDGTVPRVAATPVETGEAGAMFAGARHGSLQNADATLTHLKGALTSLALNLESFRGGLAPVPVRVGLALDDVFLRDEPVVVRVRSETPAALEARICETATGREVARASLPARDEGWSVCELRPLAPGAYRIRVSGPEGVEPVEDVFAVLDATGK